MRESWKAIGPDTSRGAADAIHKAALATSEFCLAWTARADAGVCDGIGGMEFCRVLEEWNVCNRPANVGQFIADRASLSPHTARRAGRVRAAQEAKAAQTTDDINRAELRRLQGE